MSNKPSTRRRILRESALSMGVDSLLCTEELFALEEYGQDYYSSLDKGYGAVRDELKEVQGKVKLADLTLTDMLDALSIEDTDEVGTLVSLLSLLSLLSDHVHDAAEECIHLLAAAEKMWRTVKHMQTED